MLHLPTVPVNGIHMYYEIHGQGEPLVLIAGLATDITVYERMIRELSHHYQVIVFDNRGAGRTEKPNSPYSIEMMADDTAGLLTVLGIAQAHLLGISMGGRIAITLTLQHPPQVKSLILVSTCVKLPLSLTGRLLNVLLKLPLLRTWDTNYPQPYYAAVRQCEASRSYDATDRLHEIGVPTLILHGKKDRFASYKLTEEMHTSIRGSKMIVFNGGMWVLALDEGNMSQIRYAVFL